MKTILHILNTGEYSGAENVVVTIIENYANEYRGIYMSLKGPIEEIVKRKSIAFYGVSKLSVGEIRTAIDKLRPDVIHAHDFTAGILAAVAAKKIPVISHLHNNVPWMKKISLKSFFYRLCIWRFQKILAVSDSVFDECWYGSRMRKKGICIGNPIDLKRIRGQKQKRIETNLLFVGRLAEQKNPLEFLEIVRELKNMNVPVKARMLGQGVLKEKCQDYISNYRLDDCVTMQGFVDCPYDYMNEGEILVMPSRWEGFGLVAVEALAFGMPVIGNPVGGLPGIVTEKCGLLSFDRSRKVKEISMLLSQKEYYGNKSKAALQQADKLENMNTYMKKIYSAY